MTRTYTALFVALMAVFSACNNAAPEINSTDEQTQVQEPAVEHEPADHSSQEATDEEAVDVSITDPVGYERLEEKTGDLDKDGVEEMVIIYNFPKAEEEAFARDIHIYKQDESGWSLLESSKSAIMGSDDGGMMGDPYVGFDIKNGILLIEHFGGSAWRWGHTDKYRFQKGAFELIGYTGGHGRPCEEWTTVDFNLSTGKVIYKKEYGGCEEEDEEVPATEAETFYQKDIHITLRDRKMGEVQFTSPELGVEIYL